jgi:hypothetical protein
MSRIGGCVAVVALSLVVGKLDASIILNLSTQISSADSGMPGLSDLKMTHVTQIPFTTPLIAYAGDTMAMTMVNHSGTLFDFNLHHERGVSFDNGGSMAFSGGYDDFMVTGPTAYEISGAYSMIGRGVTVLITSLFDATSGEYLFCNYQANAFSPDVQFTLGEGGGDFIPPDDWGGLDWNEPSGSLTGTLTSGHHYNFYYDAYIWNDPEHPDFYGQATADGWVSIAFISSNVVPEPATLIVWSLLGATALVIARCRRRSSV